jgi:predicted DNA-binding transcriptional regulator YafY
MGILLEFQARGDLRAEDLAATFEVSVRTIYRDVEALCETGVPVVATPGKGYRLLDGYFLPPVSFTADEAALLLLGGELVRDRVDPELRKAAEEALRKLASVLPAEGREGVEQRRQGLAFGRMGTRPDDERLMLARRALEERRVVRLLYHAFRRGEPEPRDVEPTRLVFLRDTWYLAGYCRLRQGPRIFRLDRIDRFDVLDEQFVPAARHAASPTHERDLTAYPVARVRFDDAAVRWVREQQPYVFLREEAGTGGPEFVYAVRDEQELVGWLLSWGRAVEVLEPGWLGVRLAAEARAILVRHGAVVSVPAR